MRNRYMIHKQRSENGAVLFLTLGVMVLLLSLALTFSAVSISRLAITDNQADAVKAKCNAYTGIADALNRLASDPAWRAGIAETDFAGGTYSVDVSMDGATGVVLLSTGKHGKAVAQRKVKATVPPSTGTIYAWALREGNLPPAWTNSYKAHDDARGPNGERASFIIEDTEDQSFAGFRIEQPGYPITRVEVVVYYRLPQNLQGGRLEVRWHRISDNRRGSWHRIDADTMNSSKNFLGIGNVIVDITADPPPGGWSWGLFSMNRDFQIEVKLSELESYDKDDRMYVDCVGFKITW